MQGRARRSSWSARAPRSLGSVWSAKEAADAEVLVDIRPVDSLAIADESPVLSLSRISVKEAREPRQRHGHATAIGQFDRQLIVIDRDADRSWIHVRAGSSQFMPPGIPVDARPRAAPAVAGRALESDSKKPRCGRCHGGTRATAGWVPGTSGVRWQRPVSSRHHGIHQRTNHPDHRPFEGSGRVPVVRRDRSASQACVVNVSMALIAGSVAINGGVSFASGRPDRCSRRSAASMTTRRFGRTRRGSW